MKIAVISLIRRGGMVHFHAELVNSLSRIIPTMAIISDVTPSSYYLPEIPRLLVHTGQGGAFGTFINGINPLSWYRLYKTLQAAQADLFHVVSSHAWNPLLGVLVKLLKRPLIFTMHDPVPHTGGPIYLRMSDAVFSKLSDAIVVLSRLGKEQLLIRGMDQAQVFYIPLGIYSFFAQKRSRQARQEKVILFFGRIEPYKGLDLLIKAFKKIANLLPDWKLVIAGNGDVSPYFPDIHHPQIEVINRYIPDNEVSSLMERSCFVVLPYTEATQSGVLPIAYALARPVIAADVGSLKEMVIHERTGLLIPPNDVEELAVAMKKLATDSLLCSQMGRYAYEMSLDELSWEKIAQQYIAMYSNVLEAYLKN